MSDDTRETIREAFTYYTRHPIEFLGDLVSVLGMFVMVWFVLLL